VKCERSRNLLPLLVDRAIGPLRRAFLTRHLAHCADCAGELEELQAMQAAIRGKLPYHRAPPALAARIGSALALETPPAPARTWLRRPAIGFVGSGLAGAVAAIVLMVLLHQNAGVQQSFVRSAIDSHIRSMMADHLTDVTTSNQHTVKPFLSAHVDVSPPVRDLAAQGFPLVGGRLDYVDGHPAAAVVYRHARHIINLFAWASPGSADAGFRTAQYQGFNTVTWRRDGVSYCAVSDVEANQLAIFAHDIAQPG